MKIFTDGSCLGNKEAGVGVYIQDIDYKFHGKVIGTNEIKMTSQASELTASILGIIYGLVITSNTEEKICIYTDSMYVINCATNWCDKWLKNNWKDSKKETIKNLWLVKNLVTLTKKYKIEFKHVMAHTKKPILEDILWNGNNIVDKLAQTASRNSNVDVIEWISLKKLLEDVI